MANLPGNRGSCWVAGAGPTGYSPLDGSIHAETVVVGGGIVGLTTALRLREAGRSVVLLEALEIGGQVTGRSTAKITTQHALIYRHLIDALDLARARRYAEANSAGAALIKDWIREYAIACDLERKDAYTYATSGEGREAVVAEAEAARQVGLEARVLDRAPLPFETTGALCFADQAQFNPAKYLVGLAHAVADHGGRIFEQSRAVLIGEASRWRLVTAGGTVHAEHVVVATNMTVKSPVGMASRTQPRCHTAMAFRIDDPLVVDGMFIGIDDPTHSDGFGRYGPAARRTRCEIRYRPGWERRRSLRGVGRMGAAEPGRRGGRLALVQRGLRHCGPGALCWRTRSREGSGLSYRYRIQRLGHQQRDRGRHDDRRDDRRPRQSLAEPL
ncbi:hypothetical protein ABIA22_006441 [Sinorhizobium fredii]|nr:hypothetical protein AB395_00005650 [Sinorhizobium fredii CCBAU 45436]